jgi:DNA-binding XRE family transcriptional regulator
VSGNYLGNNRYMPMSKYVACTPIKFYYFFQIKGVCTFSIEEYLQGDAYMDKVISKIKSFRLSKGIKQKWLAEQIDVHPNHLRLWEKGESYPSSLYILRMCKVMNCRIEDLLEERSDTGE